MNPFDLEQRSPFALAIALFREHYGLCATLVFASALLDVLKEVGVLRGTVGIVPAAYGTAIVAVVAHRTLLAGNGLAVTGGAPGTIEHRLVWRVLWRTLLIWFGLALIAVPIALALPLGGGRGVARVAAAIPIFLFSYGVFLSLFGTFVPDLALGSAGRFSVAFSRGRHQAGRTFAALLVYPVGVTSLIQIAINLSQFIGLPLAPYDAASGTVTWFGIIPAMLLSGSAMLAVLMTIAVLSRAYMRAEGSAAAQ